MIRKLLIYFARRSHNVMMQYRLAVLVGLLTCFGWKGSLAIYIQIGKKIAQEQQKQKRQRTPKPEVPNAPV